MEPSCRSLHPTELYCQIDLQRTKGAKQRLLDAAARIADGAGGQLAAAVLQLLGGCGRTHTPAGILQVRFYLDTGVGSEQTGAPSRLPLFSRYSRE
jgi:hypothetical protein